MDHPQCCGIENQFDDKNATNELKKYDRRGPGRHTARLLKLIREAKASGTSLLDIGGGIGGIQHALAEEGVASITSVDASPAYLATSKKAAEDRGYADRTTYHSGDFVELADQVENADLVTLDRVICCYHDVDALLGAAASKAQQAIALVFPRETFWARVGFFAINTTMRIKRDSFRAFIHPHAAVERILESHGLKLAAATNGFVWRTAVYRKLDPRS